MLGVPLLLIIIGKVYFALNYPTVILHYRHELTATVDGRPVSGSGVIEVHYRKNPQLLPDVQPVATEAYGEAVMLGFGDRGILFAVFECDFSNSARADRLIPIAWWNANSSPKPEQYEQLSSLRGRKYLRLDQLPLLVKFGMLSDPLTAETIDPHDLAASFGPDIQWQSGFVQWDSATFCRAFP